MALISLRNVSVAFGGPPLLDGINLQLEAGERLCLMGRNGTGKSTLLKLINGELPPDGGEIFRQQGLKVALVSQEIPQGLAGTVFDIVAGGTGGGAADLEDADGWRHHQAVERVLSRLKLDGEAPFETLSGGTKRRVLLARALASRPDILLLDEPTNHLDIDTIVWLEEFLLKQVRTLLFVTHDRAFARRISPTGSRSSTGAESLRLRLRLRRLRRAPGGAAGGGGRPPGALRQETGRGGGLDPPGDQGPPHPQRGAGAGAEGAARGTSRQRRDAAAGQRELQIQDAERSGRLVVEARGGHVRLRTAGR